MPVSATTALTGLRAARLKAGQTVLITGAGGGVGSLGGEGGGKWLGMGRQFWSQVIDLTTRRTFRSPVALVNPKDLATLKDMLEAGTLTPVVGSRHPLSEAPNAVRALAAGHSRGNSVITIAGVRA